MSAYRGLVVRWSRRDRLAVVGIALAAALLVGATVLLSSAGAQVTAAAAGVGSDATAEWYDSPAAARDGAGPGEVVYPVATATLPNGSRVRVVGVPAGAPSGPAGTDAPGGPNTTVLLPARPADGTALGPAPDTGRRRFEGRSGSVALAVAPGRGSGPFPDPWYVATARAVAELGPTGAVALDPGAARDATSGASGDTGGSPRESGARGGSPGSGVGKAVPDRGVPLVSALPFFVAGTEQAVGVLWPVAVGAGVLAGVVTFAVTRMAVRDRLATLGVLRATGGTRRRLLGTYALRGGLVAGTGGAAGYAVGLVAVRAAVVLGTFLGLPTTLDPRVTPPVAGVLGPALVGLVAVGALAGAAAVRPALVRPPASLFDGGRAGSGHGSASGSGPVGTGAPGSGAGPHAAPGGSWRDRIRSAPAWVLDRAGRGRRALGRRLPERVRARLEPRVLDYRAAVPTAAALSVFAAAVLLVAGLAATLAPLAATDAGAVTQPGSAHPISSRVDAGTATALRAQGVAASPEILLLSVSDGRPFLARGANYSAFAAVAGASLVRGERPTGRREAAIGRDLARALGVGVGDTVLLGGTTRPRVAAVRVVGVFRAPGLRDDQLVVALPTARHLTDVGRDRVNLVRVADPDRVGAGDAPGSGGVGEPGAAGGRGAGSLGSVVVTDLSAPGTVRAGDRVELRVTLRNLGTERAEVTVPVAVGDRATNRSVAVPAGDRRRIRVGLAAPPPGTYSVTVGNLTRRLRVETAEALRLGPVPERAPPGATLSVAVTDPAGDPVANATVRVGPAAARTDDRGVARVPLPGPGQYDVVASAPDRTRPGRTATGPSIRVAEGAPRLPVASLRVEPARPTVFERPTAVAALHYPYAGNRSLRVAVAGPRGETGRVVDLRGGERTSVSVPLGRATPGSHEAVLRAGEGRVLARAGYEVVGDDRVVSALAASGRVRRGGGLGRGVAGVLGNLRVVLATVAGLSALATVGTVAAAFASAVHARRETLGIRRTTGATPRAVVATVLGDAARVAAASIPPALAAGWAGVVALRWLGLSTVFGITVAPASPVLALAAAGAGGFLVALCGATLAAVPAARAPPAALLSDSPAGDHPAGAAGTPSVDPAPGEPTGESGGPGGEAGGVGGGDPGG